MLKVNTKESKLLSDNYLYILLNSILHEDYYFLKSKSLKTGNFNTWLSSNWTMHGQSHTLNIWYITVDILPFCNIEKKLIANCSNRVNWQQEKIQRQFFLHTNWWKRKMSSIKLVIV